MIDKILSNTINEGKIKSSELAKALGISTQTLYGWKKGASVPPLDYLPLIVKCLGLDLNTLNTTNEIREGFDASLFGSQLKKYRESTGSSYVAFSQRAGVTRQTISKWEKGESYPNIDTFYALCSTLSMKPEFFFLEMGVQVGMASKEDNSLKVSITKHRAPIVAVLFLSVIIALSIPTGIYYYSIHHEVITPGDNQTIRNDGDIVRTIQNPDYELGSTSPAAGYSPEIEEVSFDYENMQAFIDKANAGNSQIYKRPLLGLGYFDGKPIYSAHRTLHGKPEYYNNPDWVQIAVSIAGFPQQELFIIPSGKTGFQYYFNGRSPGHFKWRTSSTSFKSCNFPLTEMAFYETTFIEVDESDFSNEMIFNLDGSKMSANNGYIDDAIPENCVPAGKYLYGWERINFTNTYKPILGDAPIDITLDLDGGTINQTIPNNIDIRNIRDLPTPSRDGYRFIGYSFNGGLVNRRTTLGNKCTLKAEYMPLEYTIRIDGEIYGHYYFGEEVYLPPKFYENSFVDHYTTTDGYIFESTFRIIEDLDLKSYEISYEDYFHSLTMIKIEDYIAYTGKSPKLRTLLYPESIQGCSKYTMEPGFDLYYVDTIVSSRNGLVRLAGNGDKVQTIYSDSENLGFQSVSHRSRLQVMAINNNKNEQMSELDCLVDYLHVFNPFEKEIGANYRKINANKSLFD